MNKWRVLAAAAVVALGSALAVPVELKVALMVGDKPLVMGQTYTNPAGNTYEVNLLRFYITQVALVKRDGSEVRADGLHLVEFSPTTPQELAVMKMNVPAGEYAGIRFSIGVPRELNHLDVVHQKAPLGMDSGMYWSWNPGYIFYRFEGKYLKGTTPTPFLMHMGTDSLMQNIQLADLEQYSTSIKVPSSGIRVNLDVSKVFASGLGGQAYDLNKPEYAQVHGGPVSQQVYLNLLSAWSLAK